MSNSTEKYTPIIPMRDIIVFPEMVAPIFVTKQQSTIAVDNALLTEEHEVILLSLKNLTEGEVNVEDFNETGILGKIIQILKFPDGSVKALIEGLKRIKADDIQNDNSLLKSKYNILEEINVDSSDTKALIRLSLDKFQQYIQKSTKITTESFIAISEIQEAGKLADILATYLPLSITEKHKFLKLSTPTKDLK